MSDYVFIVSVATPQGIRSSRTTNPVCAFARARRFPSAIMAWEIEGDEAQCFVGKFTNREELNKFFDFLRRGMPKECDGMAKSFFL